MSERPWLRHYDDGVPHTLAPYPAITLLDILRDNARELPGDDAFLFMGGRLSYQELDRQSTAFAAGLRAEGVGKGCLLYTSDAADE